MWIGIFLGVAALTVFSGLFLIRRALRLGPCKRLYQKNKCLGILLSLWPIAVCLPFLRLGTVTFAIVFLHLFLFWVLADVVGWAMGKRTEKKTERRYFSGWIALCLTAVYLTYGWCMAHTVQQTNYRITTDKPLDGGKSGV